jgi:hypothetical protein
LLSSYAGGGPVPLRRNPGSPASLAHFTKRGFAAPSARSAHALKIGTASASRAGEEILIPFPEEEKAVAGNIPRSWRKRGDLSENFEGSGERRARLSSSALRIRKST